MNANEIIQFAEGSIDVYVSVPNTSVLADLCGRRHRSFGVMAAERSARCHTFLIDRKGILRLRVTHNFVDRDMKTLCKIVGLTDIRKADTEPEHRPEYVPVYSSFS
jgi:alkyl hydroperoxide reductase subunit AhpC